MNKKIIKPVILSITAIVILVISTIVYAWYTNTDRVNQEIDGSTDDIVLDYNINNEETTTTSYKISNLTFFDIDNENELKYLSSMAVCLELNITNYSKNDVDVTVSFKSDKKEKKDEDEKEVISNAYVEGIVLSKDKVSDDGKLEIPEKYKTISDYITANKTTINDDIVSSGNISNLAQSKSTTIYIYLFGVQTVDSATNEDFLYEIKNGNKTYIDYKFTITIKATKANKSTEATA